MDRCDSFEHKFLLCPPSKMEEASIGVPSPLVIESKHNLLWNESGDGTSQSLDVVAEEVTDIVVGKSTFT